MPMFCLLPYPAHVSGLLILYPFLHMSLHVVTHSLLFLNRSGPRSFGLLSEVAAAARAPSLPSLDARPTVVEVRRLPPSPP